MYCRQEMKNFIKHRHDAAEVPRACELYVWVCICGSRKKRYTMWERDSMEHKANNFAQCENVVYQTPNKLLAAHLLLLSLQYYWITLSWTFLNGICRWIPHFFRRFLSHRRFFFCCHSSLWTHCNDKLDIDFFHSCHGNDDEDFFKIISCTHLVIGLSVSFAKCDQGRLKNASINMLPT